MSVLKSNKYCESLTLHTFYAIDTYFRLFVFTASLFMTSYKDNNVSKEIINSQT